MTEKRYAPNAEIYDAAEMEEAMERSEELSDSDEEADALIQRVTSGTLWVSRSKKRPPTRDKAIEVSRITDDGKIHFTDNRGTEHQFTVDAFLRKFEPFEEPTLSESISKMVEEMAHEGQKMPPNPKKVHGAGKPDLSLVPPVAIAHAAMAFEDGGYKYGPYNWRESAVEARTYIAAAKRHLNDYLDRTDTADDSEVHNLGHVIACCAILLDAQANGNLIDDRPVPGKSAEVHNAMKAQKAGFRERGLKQWSPGSLLETLSDRARALMGR